MRSRFARARRGAVSVVFAASLAALLGVVGLAIDMGFAAEDRSQLDAAADGAVVQAARVISSAFTAGRNDYIAEGQAAAQSWFTAQSGQVMRASVNPPTVAISQTGASFTVQISYGASAPTYLAQIFGVSGIPLGGTATATLSLNAYVDIIMLLDNSSSMLIAATQSGINQMQSLTPCSAGGPTSNQLAGGTCVYNGVTQPLALACGFACHWSAAGPDWYQLARQNNIQLRFDVLQSATQQVIAAMAQEQVIPNQFGVGVYTFNSALTQVYPAGNAGGAGNDFTAAEAAVQALQTPVVVNDGDTNFPAAMAALGPRIGVSGDGSTVSKPRINLFIVTDGIVDYDPRALGVSEGPFNPNNCAAIKALGVSIYVLYTPYTPLPNNSYYNTHIAQYINTPPTPNLVSQGLQACASSPANFYSASDPNGINAALQAMLKAAINSPTRLKT